MSLEIEVKNLRKDLDNVIKAQKLFYPKLDEIIKLQKALVKAFNELNKSASSMGSMASLFGSVYEENKDTINVIANQISESMKTAPKKEEKELSV